MLRLSRRAKVSVVNLGLVFLLLFLVWLSPSEETLGSLIKLVYVHAAIVYAAFFTFMLAGVFGIIYIFTSQQKIYSWLSAFQRTAFLFWGIYFLSSIVLTYLAWGGVGWMEPRFQLAIQILVMVSLVFLFSLWLDKPKVTALLNVGLFLVIFYLTSTVQRIFHPSNPIGKSNSSTMKFFALSMASVCFLIALLTAYLLRPSQQEIENNDLKHTA